MYSPEHRRAAEVLAKGGTAAQAAKAAGKNRSTVFRWQKEQSFLELVEGLRAEASRQDQTLDALVPLAFETLEQALRGETKITATMARVALDTLKQAAQLSRSGGEDDSTFEARLAELDAAGY